MVKKNQRTKINMKVFPESKEQMKELAQKKGLLEYGDNEATLFQKLLNDCQKREKQ